MAMSVGDTSHYDLSMRKKPCSEAAEYPRFDGDEKRRRRQTGES